MVSLSEVRLSKLISQYGKESPEKVYEFTKSLRDVLDE